VTAKGERKKGKGNPRERSAGGARWGKGKDESQIGGGGEGVKASRVYTGEELARVYAEGLSYGP
jgi:hypothetical protein